MVESLLIGLLVLSVSFLFSIICFQWFSSSGTNHQFPGPRGLPFLGSLPFISSWHPSKLVFKGLDQLHKIHGLILGFRIGPQLVVSIAGYEACKEALQIATLEGRPDNAPARMKSKGNRRGLMLVDEEFWSIQRRFSLCTMRRLGTLGKLSNQMEELMKKEIVLLLDRIRLSGSVQEFKHLFSVPFLNVLWGLLGNRQNAECRPDHAHMEALVKLIDFITQSGDIVRAALPIPSILLQMFPNLFAKLGRMDLMEPAWAFIKDAIEKHKNTAGETNGDFIDFYQQHLLRNDNLHNSFSEDQLMNIVLDLFAAGSHTTSNSIGFAVLFLIHHQDVQIKMQEELDRVCGNSLPTMDHKSQSLLFHSIYRILHYAHCIRSIQYSAVLMEVQRVASVAPLGIPRRATQETPFRGFIIPKNAYVILNYHSIHMDPDYWKDAERFRPERHIDKDGELINSDHLLPFGYGKRSCLGETLARTGYFLFTTSLIKSFAILPLDKENLPSLEPLEGFTLAYRPFQAQLIPRNNDYSLLLL